jgi:hypothetical protein
MADSKPARVREGLEVFEWKTVALDDVALPLIVDFRDLTVELPQGVGLEGTLDGEHWYTLTGANGVPLTAPRPDRLSGVQERVYQVRPVGVGVTRLYMGRA